jgi:hypothetical protein
MKVCPFLVNRCDSKNLSIYMDCLNILNQSCQRLNMEIEVLTELGLNCELSMQISELNEDLMIAVLESQRDAIAKQTGPIALCGIDCVFLSRPDHGLDNCDLMVTTHNFKDCRLNTGLIMSAGPQNKIIWDTAIDFLKKSRRIRWGDDQKALLHALGNLPIVTQRKIVKRGELTIAVEPCTLWNWAPENISDDANKPIMLHFRGPRKSWIKDWWNNNMCFQ